MHIPNKFKEYSNFHRILSQKMPKMWFYGMKNQKKLAVSSVIKFVTNLTYAVYIAPPPEYLGYGLSVAYQALINGGLIFIYCVLYRNLKLDVFKVVCEHKYMNIRLSHYRRWLGHCRPSCRGLSCPAAFTMQCLNSFFSYQHFSSGVDIKKRGHNIPICSVKKVEKGKDYKLDVTRAHFRLDGHSYPFDPEVYQKGKIECFLNVPALNNSVKCGMDEIRSYDVVAIGGCTAMHFK